MTNLNLTQRARQYMNYKTGLYLLWIGLALLAISASGAVLSGHLVYYP